MWMRRFKHRCLSLCFRFYLGLLEHTCRIRFIGREQFLDGRDLIGFWHEDSFILNLLLKRLKRPESRLFVTITADERGDYIEDLVRRCRGTAYRLPYDERAFGSLKQLIVECQQPNTSAAVAWDGPLGPRHVPKKLLCLLSNRSKRSVLGVSVAYSRKIRLIKRWDRYVVPLPFSRITATFHPIGVISAAQMKQFSALQSDIREKMMPGAAKAPVIFERNDKEESR